MTEARDVDNGLPLATSTWDEAEYKALSAVIESGRFTMGERVARFEAAFAELHKVDHAVMVNSGSSANLLMVAAAVLHPDVPLSAGDEVIVPAVGWSTSYFPLQQYGLKLRFVDIDPLTLNLDPSATADAVTSRTKAILAINLLGNPAAYDQLAEIATANDLLLLEDNCESLGAKVGTRMAGTFGFMSSASTFFSHHISTMEGGVVATEDRLAADIVRSLRAHGWLREIGKDSQLRKETFDPFLERFRFVLPGYNVRPLEMSGALGIEQLRKLPALVAGRRANATTFVKAFDGFDHAVIQREAGESSWFGFALTLVGSLAGRRAEVVALLESHGIECRPIVAGNFANNPAMSYLDASIHGSLPFADRLDRDGLFFGNHHYDVSQGILKVRELLGSLAG